MFLLLVCLLGGGWFAADRLSAATASGDRAPYVLQTVQRVVTVREKGQLIRKLVPVIRRVQVEPVTQYRTQTLVGTTFVTTPGGVRVKRVVRYVPKTQTHVVTSNGRTRTVSETRLVPTTRIETRTRTAVSTVERERTVTDTAVETRTVTNERTIRNTETDTVLRTVTQTQTETETAPPVTVTATLPSQTVIVTVTVRR